MANDSELEELEKRIGTSFKDRELFRQSLVHRSHLNENPDSPMASNERLEFLGDAVLGIVTADYLYRVCPLLPEGELTALRTVLVRAEMLARIANTIELGKYLYLSRGEEAGGGRSRSSILSSAVEALVGAVFLDQGWETSRKFVLRLFADELTQAIEGGIAKDPKSRLQELAQARIQFTPTYRTVATEGPDHDLVFTVEVLVGDNPLARGTGKSKQEAEQMAARRALESWGEVPGRGVAPAQCTIGPLGEQSEPAEENDA